MINLAGESIAAHRWSDAQKQRILDSRVNATTYAVPIFEIVPSLSLIFT